MTITPRIGACALVITLATSAAFGQITSVKRITRSLNPPATNAAVRPQSPAPAAASTRAFIAVPPREKTKAEKEEQLRKTIEFQKKSAAEGSSSSQYDLGMRYLNGDGVEKNVVLARKWLKAAADQEHTQARQQLQLLK